MTISRRLSSLFSILLAVAGCVACGGHVVREARSPDGRVSALAYDAPYIDGPNQTLFIRRGHDMQQLATLAPDNEGCSHIVWRDDGIQVAFIVSSQNDVDVRIYDARSGGLISRTEIAPYWTELRNVRFTDNGRFVFEQCGALNGPCTSRSVLLPQARR